MLKLKHNWILIILFLTVSWACQEDEELVNPQVDENLVTIDEETLIDTTFKIMKEWYLWNNDLPTVNVDDFASADDLLNALRNPLDKWSYIEEEEKYDNFFNNAQYEGYGFRMVFDDEDRLRVAFAYRDSPFGKIGADRSWIINKINGKDISTIVAAGGVTKEISKPTNTFELIDDKGEVITHTLTKETIGINTVLHHQIFEAEGMKVGYLVFNSFLATSIDELKPVFKEFYEAGIDELILDLRYNGGGRVNVASYMAANIVGNQGVGKKFIEFVHNPDKTSENISYEFSNADYPLDLNRLITITSGNTASASELVINSLDPFMDVAIIGDNTHGKPVGSSPYKVGGYAINPISFKITNDNGEGEYYNGFTADSYIEDDLDHMFGDVEEARLKEALNYLKTGIFSTGSARVDKVDDGQKIEWNGFRQEIGAY